METLDEQLDAANEKVAALTSQLAAMREENSALQTANEELRDNLAHTKGELDKETQAHRMVLEEVQQLKAQAKSAEERAAEYYGTPATPQPVTAKGDPEPLTVKERFASISDPAGQTAFLRSLTEAQRAELFSNL